MFRVCCVRHSEMDHSPRIRRSAGQQPSSTNTSSRLASPLCPLAKHIGGLPKARKVGETVSKKMIPMNHSQGFTANLITGLLVTTASVHGMPVSTTNVSVGSIFGIGTITKKADVRVVFDILLSWLLTLLVAAVCSAAVYWLMLQVS